MTESSRTNKYYDSSKKKNNKFNNNEERSSLPLVLFNLKLALAYIYDINKEDFRAEVGIRNKPQLNPGAEWPSFLERVNLVECSELIREPRDPKFLFNWSGRPDSPSPGSAAQRLRRPYVTDHGRFTSSLPPGIFQSVPFQEFFQLYIFLKIISSDPRRGKL